MVSSTVAGCDDVVFNGRSPSYASCLRDPPLTWENYGKGHMDKHCNGCHSSLLVREELRNGAPLGIDFDTWEGNLQWADRIYQRGAVEVSMPPGGGPSTEELRLLEEWLLCDVLPASAEFQLQNDRGSDE
ncbi:MAG: hypothetical protein R3F61_09410 [Myxococcota bacterium]